MTIPTMILIALAALIALGFSFFQYLYRNKKQSQKNYIFFSLRALSVFVLLLLLINPQITTTSYEEEKPRLLLAVDNSASIAHLEQTDSLREVLRTLKNDAELQERFEVQQVNFGKDISVGQEPEFDQPQTDIFSALNDLRDLGKRNSAVLLISDGNQTFGRDYQYYKAPQNQAIIPVVIGDTTTYTDLELSELNTNRYAFLDNRFPVEAILNYTGDESVSTSFEIRSGTNTIYTENLEFDGENSTAIIQAELPANRIGVLDYEAEIIPLNSEKNKLNNSRKFAVEVIDERTKVLLITSISHPDLGTIKQSIESNRQRELKIVNINNDNYQLEDYQLVILYQPNHQFREVFGDLLREKINHFVVTGTQTNWSFLNNLELGFKKESAFQSQEIFAEINPNFTQFQFEDIGFSDFPPLEDKFGEIIIHSNSINPLLFQKIEGVETDQPLLVVTEETAPKMGALFGENIWRWRAASFVAKQSFEEFDDFFGKIIQNLSSQKRKERLTLDYESFYYANQEILIEAQYFDENYQFDPGASITISFNEEALDDVTEASLLVRNNRYVVDLGSLEPGDYEFTVEAANTGIFRSGKFSIIDFDVEQQFASANWEKMQYLAQNNNENIYFPSGIETLVEFLKKDKRFAIVQKSREKAVPLIEWYYLLYFLVILLAAEWFLRKYRGLI